MIMFFLTNSFKNADMLFFSNCANGERLTFYILKLKIGIYIYICISQVRYILSMILLYLMAIEIQMVYAVLVIYKNCEYCVQLSFWNRVQSRWADVLCRSFFHCQYLNIGVRIKIFSVLSYFEVNMRKIDMVWGYQHTIDRLLISIYWQ